MQDLEVDDLPDGELYLHADVDVIDTSEVPDLLYQVPGGPRLADVLDAVSRITTLRRVAAGGIAATWRYERAAAVHHQALRQLSDAANPPGPERTD